MTTRTEPPAAAARAAAIAWHRGHHDAICDSIVPWAHGRVVRASEFPTYWDYNLLYAAGPLDGIDATELARVADERLGDLAHRHVQVEDERAGERLRAGFQALGYRATPLLYMRHEGDLPPVRDDVRLREAPDAESEPLRRRWFVEDPWQDAAVLDAFIRDEGRVFAQLGGHVLLAEDPGSAAPVAYVRIRVAGAVGEVAEAYAAPEFRNRGIGGALVAAGVRSMAAAGARHVFIVADGAGRSQGLYGRLGFRTVWVLHQFVRRPGTI